MDEYFHLILHLARNVDWIAMTQIFVIICKRLWGECYIGAIWQQDARKTTTFYSILQMWRALLVGLETDWISPTHLVNIIRIWGMFAFPRT